MKPIGELISIPTLASLTDEQWAAHDAKVAKAEAERLADEEARRVDALRRDLVARGCPVKDLERATSGNLEETRSVAAARRAIVEGWTLCALAGDRGVGKSTAAAWWLLQRREPSKYVSTVSARFADATSLARWPKYDDGKMRELERASALVIDDLGVEYDDKGGAFRSFFDGLVNARHSACLPTMLTTNLGADEFKARYGERIADRIREAGRYVELAGESMRRTEKVRVLP